MSVRYEKLYAYLVGQVDKALTLLDEGDLVKAQPVREILQQALLTAEREYVDNFEERACTHIEVLAVQKENEL